MHGKNIIETVIGAVVLIVAVGFIYIAYKSGNISRPDGYTLTAKFDRVDGLGLGSDVRVSGLKVGSVTDQKIEKNTYMAVISINVDDDVQLPSDSTAEIVSDGLLGGKYLALVPGGSEEMLKTNDEIRFTQSSISIEQLIGKFVFGSAGDKAEDAEPNPESEQKEEKDVFSTF